MKLAIILLGLLLVSWSVFIPVFEGADEGGHYCHGEYIARNRRLPNFNIRDGCFLAYPPGYYALAAPIIALRPAANFDDEQIQPNPLYISNRKGKDVFSKYIHFLSELTFQWNPLLQTVHLVRLVSAAMGLGIIFLTIKAAKLTSSFRGSASWRRRGNPDEIATLPRPKVGVARNDFTNFRWLPYSSVILFFNPMFLHTFSLVTNVTLVSFLAAAFIYLHLKQEVSGSSGKLALLQGIVFGLGAITKINMLGLAGGYAFALLTSKWNGGEKLKHLGFVSIGFITSAGWYIWRTLRLYGEPFEINIASSFRGASMTRIQDMGLINYWSSFPDTLFRTFWSGYGLNKVWLPDIVVVGLLVATLLTVMGFMSQYRKLPRIIKVCSYYILAVLIGHVIVNIKTEAFHAKDIFTAYLPFALFAGVGFKSLADLSRKKLLGGRSVFILVAVAFAFYAKFEIVRLIKAILIMLNLAGFYTPESISPLQILSSLISKVGIVGFLMWGLLRLIRVGKLTDKIWKQILVVASFVNLIILSYASYLLYSGFL